MKKLMVRILCCFVPGSKNRHKVRAHFLKTEETLDKLTTQIKSLQHGNSKNICKTPDITIDKNQNAIFKSSLYNSNNQTLKLENNAFCLFQNFVAKGTIIGRYSYIGERTSIDKNVQIGRYCSISSNVLIGATIHPQNWLSTSPIQYDNWLDGNHSKKTWEISKPTIIENDVWIGSGVIIKSGITVHNGAIIGSGAVVTHDVPPYAIVVGVPAKIIKYRFEPDVIKELLETKWWDLPHSKIRKLPFDNIYKCLKELKK